MAVSKAAAPDSEGDAPPAYAKVAALRARTEVLRQAVSAAEAAADAQDAQAERRLASAGVVFTPLFLFLQEDAQVEAAEKARSLLEDRLRQEQARAEMQPRCSRDAAEMRPRCKG